MWQTILAELASPAFIAKVLGSIAIFIVATIIAMVLNMVIGRWRVSVVKLLQKKSRERATALETQIRIIRRLIVASIYSLAFVLALLQFDAARNIGTGLLASAGVAGIVIGMAAQSTLSNIVAGVIISFSQPVRLNDAVIFEGDFGLIEEISLMHTVIRTWDNRRIVVPNGVLANKVIQNWTLKDPSLLGVVMIYVDYYCDVELVRQWVVEIVKSSQYWSKELDPGVQVVDLTDKHMVLRALAHGIDAPATWNLRCELREKLVARFRAAGVALPRIRVEQQNPA
ncbi:MAG: mechanosensitive ion channel family protein [Candidatus Saganbacteria bacterium]|nr:mechanosensitive ion channel family protein [Candidatus Saganbacteria bacterium]